MKYALTIPPTGRPVEWTLAKAHLRLDSDDEQALVETYLDAAADFAAEAMACSLMAQTITATFYHGEPIHLPRGPVIEIVSVTDDDGHAVTDFDLWKVGHSDRIRINVPYKSPLTVVYTAGYPTADAIPASIRQGILVHAATLYENRESVSDRTKTVVPHSLADFYRLKSRNVGVG